MSDVRFVNEAQFIVDNGGELFYIDADVRLGYKTPKRKQTWLEWFLLGEEEEQNEEEHLEKVHTSETSMYEICHYFRDEITRIDNNGCVDEFEESVNKKINSQLWSEMKNKTLYIKA